MSGSLGHDGNWAELRRLVLRLLEEHEELLEKLRVEVKGSAGTPGLTERMQALEVLVEEARRRLDALDKKANSAHDKINKHLQDDGCGKRSKKQTAVLVGIISALAAGLLKLAEILYNLMNAPTPPPGG